MKYRPLPDADYLRCILRYEPMTGEFFWLEDRDGGPRAGDAAGCLTVSGRDRKKPYPVRVINIDGILYLGHRIAWKIVTGRDPAGEIDHRDSDSTNNAFENLREATRLQNSLNIGTRTDNKSGVKGVSWDSVNGKWVARIRVHKGKYRNLGRFDDVEDAAAAYRSAATQMHGEFVRFA